MVSMRALSVKGVGHGMRSSGHEPSIQAPALASSVSADSTVQVVGHGSAPRKHGAVQHERPQLLQSRGACEKSAKRFVNKYAKMLASRCRE